MEWCAHVPTFPMTPWSIWYWHFIFSSYLHVEALLLVVDASWEVTTDIPIWQWSRQTFRWRKDIQMTEGESDKATTRQRKHMNIKYTRQEVARHSSHRQNKGLRWTLKEDKWLMGSVSLKQNLVDLDWPWWQTWLKGDLSFGLFRGCKGICPSVKTS